MRSPPSDLSSAIATGRPTESVVASLEEEARDRDRREFRRFIEEGDRDALGALSTRFESDLLGVAQGFLAGNHALAREAVQNAWLRVIRYGKDFDHRATVRTWLYRIVLNECRTLRTRELNRERRERSLAERAPTLTADRADASTGVANEVARLPDHLRETVLLAYHAELSHAHVADILMIPVGTVKSRLHAALNLLRLKLEGSDR